MPFWNSGSFQGGFFGSIAPFSPLTNGYSPAFWHSPTRSTLSFAGGYVTNMTDISGNSLAVSQADAARRPYYNTSGINGKTALQYSSGQSIGSATGFPTVDYSKVCVAQLDLTNANGLNLMSSDGGHALWYGQVATTCARMRMYHGVDFCTSKVQSHPYQPEVTVTTYTQSTKTGNIYTNGTHTGQGTTTTNNADVTFAYGDFNTYNLGWDGFIGDGLGYASVLNSAGIAYHSRTLCHDYGINPHWYVVDGDSLTTGDYANDVGSWPYQFRTLLGSSAQAMIYNDAISGDTLTQADTEAAAANGIDSLTFLVSTGQTLVIWCGTNDINAGASAATTYSRLLTYITNRKATNLWNRIVVVTLIPRDTAPLSDSMIAYNVLLRTNWAALQAAGATHLADTETISQFSTDTAWSNTTYYLGDRIHLTPSGNLLIAMLIKSTLGLYGSTPPALKFNNSSNSQYLTLYNLLRIS